MPKANKLGEWKQLRLDYADFWPEREKLPDIRGSKAMIVLKPVGSFAEFVTQTTIAHCVENGFPPKAYPPHLLHVSIAYLGTYRKLPHEILRWAKEAAEEIQAQPIPISFDCTAFFGHSGDHLVLLQSTRNNALEQFRAQARSLMKKHNVPDLSAAGFRPHMTTIYGRQGVPLMKISQPLNWTATEFLLIYSHHGESRHEEFGRWRLDAEAPPYPVPPEQLPMRI
ncbi:2'-5' RNA ligase family protein [Neorhizobium petrolearium]|uniref:2'-5' RNA ligase family protein n=1 Tax=Neorhizobium petrolearium TaxID=515361 RepID=UPI003F162A25